MSITREVFLSKRQLKRKQVDIPEWGATVYVQELNAKQRGEFEAAATGGDLGKLAATRASLVVKCATTAEGVPLLKAGDEHVVGEMSGDIIDRIFTAILEISGMLGTAAESASGNLPAPPPDALQ